MIACPGCGANLRFDIQSQQMKCTYCGESYDPARFAGMTKDAESSRYYDAYVFNCSGCGAELITADETDATGYCPYCGGTSILFDRLRKVKMPSGIIPFRLTKEECRKAYGKAARRAIFTPARYKRPKLVDSFRGIYMPFWSYTVKQKGKASVRADGKTYSDSDYIYTPNYDIEGELDMSYTGYAHDASKAFDDEISECVAPFDTADRKPFSPAYLSGFYADAADVPARQYEEMARAACEQRTAEELLKTASVQICASQNQLRPQDAAHVSIPSEVSGSELVYYPVWFMSYREKNRITYAAVNGQTGKVVADFPVSPLRFLLAALLLAALLFLGLNVLFTFKPGLALGITTLLLILGVWVSGSSFSPNRPERSARGKPSFKDLLPFLFLGLFTGIVLFVFIRSLSTGETVVAIFTGMLSLLLVPMFVMGARHDLVLRFRDNADRHAAFQVPGWVKWAAGIAAVFALIILVVNPVYNLWFYIPAFLEAALLFLVFFQCFRFQLSLAMRRPPQFSKKGGDDLA